MLLSAIDSGKQSAVLLLIPELKVSVFPMVVGPSDETALFLFAPESKKNHRIVLIRHGPCSPKIFESTATAGRISSNK